MALKTPTAAANKPAPHFEEEPQESVQSTKENPNGEEVRKPVPKAQAPSPSRALAPVNPEESVSKAKEFLKEFAGMKGRVDFDYGSHRVFKADNGAIKEMSGEKLVLGRWVKARLMAWDFSYTVSPGGNAKNSGEFVAFSRDGVTIDSVPNDDLKGWIGKPVTEYVDYLRGIEKFEEAGIRKFLECQVAALGCEDDPSFNEIIQISLSSSSIPAFNKYRTQIEGKARAIEMGLPGYSLPDDPFTFFYVRENAEGTRGSKTVTWTKFKILDTLPAKI